MDCALWLNRKKVFSAEEISENLDLAALCGYFTAGSLIEWLDGHNGKEYAEKLSFISPKDPLLKEKIAEIFGGQPVSYKTFGKGEEVQTLAKNDSTVSSGSYPRFGINSSFENISSKYLNSFHFALNEFGSGVVNSGYFGSYRFSSYSFRSFLLNIGFSSYSLSSWLYSSFWYEWKWEWERIFGSFWSTSYSYGSFAEFMSSYLMKYGSRFFNIGSRFFNIFGSFNSSYLSAIFGSFNGNFGSFPESDEYDRIMFECLFGCKLNGYGYGIHNI